MKKVLFLFLPLFLFVASFVYPQQFFEVEIPYKTVYLKQKHTSSAFEKTRIKKLYIKGNMARLELLDDSGNIAIETIFRDGWAYQRDPGKKSGIKMHSAEAMRELRVFSPLKDDVNPVKTGKSNILGMECDVYEYVARQTIALFTVEFLCKEYRNNDGFLVSFELRSKDDSGSFDRLEAIEFKKNTVLKDSLFEIDKNFVYSDFSDPLKALFGLASGNSTNSSAEADAPAETSEADSEAADNTFLDTGKVLKSLFGI